MSDLENLDALLEVGHEVVDAARAAGANVAEATVQAGSHLSARVRMRKPELVEEASSRALGLRVMLDQRVATTYTSDLSANGRKRLVEDALDLVKLSEADPFAGPPDPSLLSTSSEWADLDTFDSAINDLTSEEALRDATKGEVAAFDHDERITNSEGATFSRATGFSVLVTSGGFRGTERGSYASIVVNPVADDADGKKRSGYHWSASRHRDRLEDAGEVGNEAAARTVAQLGAIKLPTQELPVVFDRDAARAIIGLLAGSIMGSAVWRRGTYLADRLDTKVASDLVTIVDDPLIPAAPGSRAFDGEGLISRKTTVVEDGVLKTFLTDTYSARKLDTESTASASRSSSGGVSPSVTNFVLAAGEQTHDELLASTPHGLYVTRMMGFGFNAVTGDFSRGASGFLIRDGELAEPVSEVTISLNLDDILKRIDAVADDLDYRTSVACPTFRVSSMTLAGA